MTETNGHGKINFWEALRNSAPSVPRVDVVPVTSDTLLNLDGWVRAALAGEEQNVTSAVVGTRNDALNTAAFNLGQIVARDVLPQEVAEQTLRYAGNQAGLDPREIESTIRSGMNAGLQHPREIKPLSTSTVTEVSPEDILGEVVEGTVEPGLGDPGPTTWLGGDMVTDAEGALDVPAPTHLVRADGKALLYSGKVNALIGESESGKSWLALLAAVQALRNGEQVMVIDFEDNVSSVLRRFLAFGFTADELRGRVRYIHPEEALGVAQLGDLRLALADECSLIIVDGVNAAMDVMGYDLNSNNDATSFYRRLLRPLAAAGACVITVDHVPKHTETRGKGGIGAQAKRAMADGACILVEVVEPFGEGQSGVLRLSVDKDRNGKLRGISAGGKVPGKVVFTSIADRVDLAIEPPVGTIDVAERREVEMLTALSRTLDGMPRGMSQNAIVKATVGNDRQLIRGLDQLYRMGHVSRIQGSRGSIIYTLIKPYPTPDEAENDDLCRPLPTSAEQRSQRPLPATPSPKGWQRSVEAVTDPQKNPTSAELDDYRCARCGTQITEEQADATAGYCRSCDRLENP